MKLNAVATLALTALLGAASASAQSSDSLLNKLVEKGILTADEARQLKSETTTNLTATPPAKSIMPEWVSSFKFNGDFRGRFDSIEPANGATVDRNRWRYRLRAGFMATLKDDFELGFRVASGDADSGPTGGYSPLSANQTFQNNASKKGVFIDQAYAKWSPLHTKDWKGGLTFGKMEDPFVFSDLGIGFDSDYTPEGGAFTLDYKLGEDQTVRWINGLFVLDELGGSGDDPFFFGSQLRLESKWSQRVSSSVGVMFMLFENTDRLANNAVPNINVGNTRAGAPPGSAVPLYQFNPILADASLGYLFDKAPFYSGAFPVRLIGQYLYNPEAPSAAGNYGWSGGLVLGKAGKKHTWELSYCYKWLGANSIWEEVVDDDFGAYWAAPPASFDKSADYQTGTNVRGHIVKLSYSPNNFLTLSAKWYLTELIVEPVAADPNSMVNRFQVDALFKF